MKKLKLAAIQAESLAPSWQEKWQGADVEHALTRFGGGEGQRRLADARKARISSSCSSLTLSRPVSVFTSTGKNMMLMTNATLDSMSKPNQIRISGASATFGID